LNPSIIGGNIVTDFDAVSQTKAICSNRVRTNRDHQNDFEMDELQSILIELDIVDHPEVHKIAILPEIPRAPHF
jgi:hypothetical protein